MFVKIYLPITLLLFLATACRPVREVTYFQPVEMPDSSRKVVFKNFGLKDPKKESPTYEHLIQPNDILSIYVSSLSPEASSFFNAIPPLERSEQTQGSSFASRSDIGYLVDAQGMIELPLIGKLKLSGLSTSVARDTITLRLERFLQFPSVRIYLENFKVTLLGEVARPGVYKVSNEKITIPEAIGLAGDLTIFANRKNILLVREENKEKKYYTIDITRRDVFNSPYFYLRSNDILYVEPVKGRIAQSDNFYRVAPLVMSTLTLIAVLAVRLNNQ